MKLFIVERSSGHDFHVESFFATVYKLHEVTKCALVEGYWTVLSCRDMYKPPAQTIPIEKKGVRFSEDLALVREIPALSVSVADTGDSSSLPSLDSEKSEDQDEKPQVKKKMFSWFRRKNNRGWHPRGSRYYEDTESIDEDSGSSNSFQSEEIETEESVTSSVSQGSGDELHQQSASVLPRAFNESAQRAYTDTNESFSDPSKPHDGSNKMFDSSEYSSEDASFSSNGHASLDLTQQPRQYGNGTTFGKRIPVPNKETRTSSNFENTNEVSRHSQSTLQFQDHSGRNDPTLMQGGTVRRNHKKSVSALEHEGIEMIARQANNGLSSILIAKTAESDSSLFFL